MCAADFEFLAWYALTLFFYHFPKGRFVPSWIRINIFTKLQVADRAEAIIKAREAGLGR